jgi:hypothetical protein
MKQYNRLYRTLFCLAAFFCMAACNESAEPAAEKNVTTEQQDTSKQNSTPVTASAPAAPVAAPRTVEAIQKAYATIIMQKERGALDSTGFTYNCRDEKRGTVSYFSENGHLKLIVHKYNEYDHHSAEDNYFVSDSTLIFTYTITVLWSFESGAEGATKDNITEQRIYLVDQKPLKCLEKKYVIRSQAKNNPRSEDVANKEVNCASAKALKPFQLLLKNKAKAPGGCLE